MNVQSLSTFLEAFVKKLKAYEEGNDELRTVLAREAMKARTLVQSVGCLPDVTAFPPPIMGALYLEKLTHSQPFLTRRCLGLG
jgi:hypothetical protein